MERFAILCSGGADSMALLHQLAQDNQDKYIHVIHVNHGLSQNADKWASLVETAVTRLPPHNLYKFVYLNINPEKGYLSEKVARDLRYKHIIEYMKDNQLTHAYTGHHLDDKLENRFISLFKNRVFETGMLPSTIKDDCIFIKRNLDKNKEELIAYCHDHGIDYVTDESNLGMDNLRNVMRNGLMQNIKKLPDHEHYMESVEKSWFHYDMMEKIFQKSIDGFLKATFVEKVEQKEKNRDRYSFDLDNWLEDDADYYLIKSAITKFIYDQTSQNFKIDFDRFVKMIQTTEVYYKLSDNIRLRMSKNGCLYLFVCATQ